MFGDIGGESKSPAGSKSELEEGSRSTSERGDPDSGVFGGVVLFSSCGSEGALRYRGVGSKGGEVPSGSWGVDLWLLAFDREEFFIWKLFRIEEGLISRARLLDPEGDDGEAGEADEERGEEGSAAERTWSGMAFSLKEVCLVACSLREIPWAWAWAWA